MKVLVVGVGSTIRGDDAVGPVLAMEMATRFPDQCEALVFDGSALDLLGLIGPETGYHRVAVIDCLEAGGLAEGEMARVQLSEVPADLVSSHHAGIRETLHLAGRLQVPLPQDLRFYGVGVRDAQAFREGLSASLAARIPDLATELARDLGLLPQEAR
ncbi:MAG TPA: hydrogenase maturation protease [Myxococcota bacterium]|nr:hydrogenase maturation protease [Myxococcota bacterium]HQK50070.1 hydrogenase maturation protease [Myxococcota bacterium]